MFAFIAHAEADQAAADELKAFLKLRGLVTETETGAKGFRHLQASDVVIALWSQKSVFATHRMQIERRMLDAWADGRLVLVKLDHSFLPIGLRDLPAIDASFESSRQLSVWPQVERAAREAMNRALVEKEKREAGPGTLNSKYGDMTGAMKPQSPSGSGAATGAPPVIQARARHADEPTPKRGSVTPIVFLLLAVAALGWAGWQAFLRPDSSPLLTNVAYGVAALGLLLLFVVFVQALRPPRKMKARQGNPALDSMDKMLSEAEAVAAAPEPAATALFISYSHADNAAVEPVVAIVEKSGRTVWMDKTGIQTGDGWAGEIVRAIKGAKGILVMCSKHAFESDHVKREIYLADRYKKPMAPVFLEAAQPPEDFEYFFAGVQWLELYKLPQAEHSAAIGKALAAV